MEPKVLTDKNIFPSESVIFSHIGKTKSLWQSIFEFIHKNYPEFTASWKYYNDGKSWLMKVQRKTKTICWVSIIKNSFRMTFYLGDKAEAAVLNSSISDELKDQFMNTKGKKFRGLTVLFKNKKDIEFAKSLIEIKLRIK